MKDKKIQTTDNSTTTVDQTVTLDPTMVPVDKLVLAPKMQAFIRQHRNDDVRTLAVPVLAHRLVCGFGSDTGSAESRMEAILSGVPVPTERFEP